jgi:hypothetical protein
MEQVNVFAKQVLSQLSYTPTVGFAFILKHFEVVRKLARSIGSSYSVVSEIEVEHE